MPEETVNKALMLLERVARALERQTNALRTEPPDWRASNAWIWQPGRQRLKPVRTTGALPLDMLVGLETQSGILLQNTRQFAEGYTANNALLWGARGMGKSSLIKAAHARVVKESRIPLVLVEIFREDLATLPDLLDLLREEDDKRFLLFCDDLSFDEQENSYKFLKVVLEGGIEARPANVLFYATSNRRHLMPRQMIENERATAIQPGESTEEKVSLSDRFGIWLGFYPCTQDEYLTMVENYASSLNIPLKDDRLREQALEWAATRGDRSGRVAWQFIQHLAGRYEIRIDGL
ncbi:MAG: ATP-binding protein [Alphaproteobacteria bacterium]|nr:ATP-binding protein [Alphaproteobacteria bacterium]